MEIEKNVERNIDSEVLEIISYFDYLINPIKYASLEIHSGAELSEYEKFIVKKNCNELKKIKKAVDLIKLFENKELNNNEKI